MSFLCLALIYFITLLLMKSEFIYMFKKHQICEILSVSEATIPQLPNFPEKIDSQYLSNLVLYRKDDVFTWLCDVIKTRERAVTSIKVKLRKNA